MFALEGNSQLMCPLHFLGNALNFMVCLWDKETCHIILFWPPVCYGVSHDEELGSGTVNSELHRMPFRHFHPAGNEPVALSTGDLSQASLALGSWEAGTGWVLAVVSPTPEVTDVGSSWRSMAGAIDCLQAAVEEPTLVQTLVPSGLVSLRPHFSVLLQRRNNVSPVCWSPAFSWGPWSGLTFLRNKQIYLLQWLVKAVG